MNSVAHADANALLGAFAAQRRALYLSGAHLMWEGECRDLASKTHREDRTSTAATTTLSSKGQVVIPGGIRLRLGLKAGAQFVAVADRDVMIFKVLDPPALGEFAPLVARARQAAKRSGLRPADGAHAIAKVRRVR